MNTKRKDPIVRLVVFLIGLLCLLLIAAGMNGLFSAFSPEEEAGALGAKETLVETERHNYDELAAINPEYVGWLSFESGLVSEPVVQCEDNSTYLKIDFYGNEEGMGTVFVDKNCTLESKNITIYGHYVYYDENARFTPLTLLREAENYEENKQLIWELKDETRRYEVAMVYIFDMWKDPDYPYMTAEFGSEEEFMEFIEYAKKKQLYETGVEIEAEDRLITLQTCVRNEDAQRLIIVAKEISREKTE